MQSCSVAELVVELSELGEAGLPDHVQLQQGVGLVQAPGREVRQAARNEQTLKTCFQLHFNFDSQLAIFI